MASELRRNFAVGAVKTDFPEPGTPFSHRHPHYGRAFSSFTGSTLEVYPEWTVAAIAETH
jgi:hypothetical protein